MLVEAIQVRVAALGQLYSNKNTLG